MKSIVQLPERDIDGETILDIGDVVLVRSKSTRAWYEVGFDYCTCAGFVYRGECRHFSVIKSVGMNRRLPDA